MSFSHPPSLPTTATVSVSVGGAPASDPHAKQHVIAALRKLQSHLSTLHSLAAADVATLDSSTFSLAESILFESRHIAREMAKHIKAMPTQKDANLDGQQLQPIFAALQSSIEKAASLLLAKHKFASGSSASVGDKRKSKSGIPADTAAKRIKGAAIHKATEPDTLKPPSQLDPAMRATKQVDSLAAQALSLQLMQEKLNAHAHAGSSHSSGSSTPSRFVSTNPPPVVPGSIASSSVDVSLMSAMSARSNDSMSSEADSDSAMHQRQEMIDNLVQNIGKLRAMIASERAARSAPPEPTEEKMDVDMDNSSLLDETSTREFVPPPGVPKLDFASLTSTCSALEDLLHKSLASMADLAAIQDRELRKKQTRRDIIGKTTRSNESPSIFAAAPASSFAAKSFSDSRVADVAAPLSAGESLLTDASCSQDGMAAAHAKRSDVPRSKAAVFGSAARFNEPPDAKKKSRAAERKALYDRYDQLFAETKAAILEAERKIKQDKNALHSDPLDATRPRLVQNVLMGVDPSLKEKGEPRSAAAAIAQHTRESHARREAEIGPGAYELENGLARTERRVLGVPSWGAGPDAADDLAKTERFVAKAPATGTLGPGAHIVSDALVTRRVTGPHFKPATAVETIQHQRARELAAEAERKKEEFEFEKDFDELDVTVRRRTPAAILMPESASVPSDHQRRAQRIDAERLAKLASEADARDEKLASLAATRRATEDALRSQKRADFIKGEEDKLARTVALRDLLSVGPPGVDLTPNYDYLLPRKPTFRYAQPKTLHDMQNEATRHGASARKRSAAQIAKEAKRQEAAEEKYARIEMHQSVKRIIARRGAASARMVLRVLIFFLWLLFSFLFFRHKAAALRSSSALNYSTMTGRPNPQSVDSRDYDMAKSMDFLARRAPGDDWARAAPRSIVESDVDPEIDDLLGGRDGDVLDLAPDAADKWIRPRVRGAAFGPKTGPDPAIGIQTLSDTELDYANGVEEEREVLYPNLDFGRKRQGAGGALPFHRQVLGGTRSDGSEDEADEFPYLAEGNLPLDPNYSSIAPKVRNGRFALRRHEFMKLHQAAKARELAREREAAGQLILNPHLATGTQRHKPAASMAFSARHDIANAADEIDDTEALGEYYDGPVRTRGGPAAYTPKFSFKDPLPRHADFTLTVGRSDDSDGDVDDRDFLGGVLAFKKDPNRIIPNSALPGAGFARATARTDREAEDRADFPDTHGDGDRLDLNPRVSHRISGGVDMRRSTGRPERDELDIESDEVRIDLTNIDGLKRKKVIGAHQFARSTGRTESDEIDIREGQADLQPLYSAITNRAPHAAFTQADRFGDGDPIDSGGGSDLNPSDAVTRANPRSAIFGSSAARPESTVTDDAQSILDPIKPALHIPQVDFTHGATRGANLPPIEDRLVLAPNDDITRPNPLTPSFTRAIRPSSIPLELGDPTLALVPPVPSSTSVVFGDESRPGNRLTFGKVGGSVLHPDSADPHTEKHAPEWTFSKERRWNSLVEEYAGASRPLQLYPDRTAIEPKRPDAFFPDATRTDQTLKGKEAEQVLALMPNIDTILARHPSVSLSRDDRFPADVDGVRQTNLYPDLSATKPKAPAATITSRPNSTATPVEGNRLNLYPRMPYPAAPAAHITSSERGSIATGPNASYHNPSLKLDPQYDTQYPRSPAHVMAERLYEPSYVPSNAEMAAYRARQQAKRTERDDSDSNHTSQHESHTPDELSPAYSPRDGVLTHVLGPSRSRSFVAPSSPSGVVADSFDVFDSSSDSVSFGLPDAGVTVVASAASLVRARREKQSAEQARAEKRKKRDNRTTTITNEAAHRDSAEVASLTRQLASHSISSSVASDDGDVDVDVDVPSRFASRTGSISAPLSLDSSRSLSVSDSWEDRNRIHRAELSNSTNTLHTHINQRNNQHTHTHTHTHVHPNRSLPPTMPTYLGAPSDSRLESSVDSDVDLSRLTLSSHSGVRAAAPAAAAAAGGVTLASSVVGALSSPPPNKKTVTFADFHEEQEAPIYHDAESVEDAHTHKETPKEHVSTRRPHPVPAPSQRASTHAPARPPHAGHAAALSGSIATRARTRTVPRTTATAAMAPSHTMMAAHASTPVPALNTAASNTSGRITAHQHANTHTTHTQANTNRHTKPILKKTNESANGK